MLILALLIVSIGKLGREQYRYYGNLAAREDYYTEGGEPEGVYLETAGARILGLKGKVSKDDLRSLFHGCKPDGTPLVQNANDPRRCPGHDAAFSSPKSVSIYWAVSSSDVRHVIQRCQHEAVTSAIRFFEQEAAFSRRGKAGCRMDPAKIIVTTHEHSTSRTGDCQLHTHAIILNIAIRPDGTTGSLESKPLYHHKMVLGAVYRAELAHLLQERLGLKIIRTGTSFELAGVPKDLCDHLSQRRQAIVSRLTEKNQQTAAAAAVAAIETRHAKDTVPPRSVLFKQWQETAAQFGLTPDKASRLLHQIQPSNDPRHAAQTVDHAIGTIAARFSAFDRRSLFRESLYAAVEHGLSPDIIGTTIDRRLQHGTDIFKAEDSGRDQDYTTADALSRRRQIAQSIRKLSSPAFRPLSRRAVDAAIGHHSKPRDPILEEFKYHIGQLIRAASGGKKTYRIDRDCIARRAQRTVNDTHIAAVKDITRSRTRIATITQGASNDRYLVLSCCREAWQRAGYNVIGVSLSNAGVKRLYQETGIETMSLKRLELMMHPTAKFQIRYHLRQLWRAAREKPTFALEPLKITKDTVLVVDGTERLSFQQMADLTRDVAKQGGRLVLAGDGPKGHETPIFTAFSSICNEVARLKTQEPSPASMTQAPRSKSTQDLHPTQETSRSMEHGR